MKAEIFNVTNLRKNLSESDFLLWQKV